MRKTTLLLMLSVCGLISASAQTAAKMEAESAAYENCKLVEDGKYSGGKALELTEGNAKITLTIPADHPTFFSTKDHVMNIWSRYEEEDSLELSNFVAVRYDDADIWFVNQDNWTNLSRGDSAISGDFIITLYYGNDTVKVRGREISI